ncbi:TspO/MBR family protein, partial [Phocaeicola vulgatus]|uniref:TspO/MBR family protein n=1 Tax=Phocaeicola vulgatus TaxID=821 RepID=UPI00356869CD
MKRIIPILIAILICFGVGCTASYFQSDSILNWYPALEKPSCTPPDIGSPDKSGGKFFNSIENLHLCTMNNQG